MQRALALARAAQAAGEVPVGAVVVRQGQLVAEAGNAPIAQHDPTAHAEIRALRQAGAVLANYRLDDCDVYVTLEPCAMCAAAMLHARIRRVVFATPDPKTGAAGSVLNLFAQPALNHHTQVESGVLADEAAHMLREFFRGQRQAQARTRQALRQDALRTPKACFAQAPALPAQSRWACDLPTLQGLRMHFLDNAPDGAETTWVLLHGRRTWSACWAAQCDASGGLGRLLIPDLIGFGRSDKPKKPGWHSPTVHVQIVCEWLERLGIRAARLVESAQDALPGLQLGQTLGQALQGRAPEALVEVSWMTLCDIPATLRNMPYPDAGHRAAWRAFPQNSKITP
ncbi:MAG: hypothetical protein Fur007_16810 [Rhodoferax sp.]